MKWVYILFVTTALLSCNNSSLDEKKSEKLENNSKYKRLLIGRWRLININCYVTEKKDYEEYHYGNINLDDSLYKDFYLNFSKDGSLIYNDSVNISTWKVEQSAIKLNGKNQSEVFFDVKSDYIIKSINSRFLRLCKYYFDSKGVVNFRIDYQFINTSKLADREDLFEI